ncbi:hypothetical protein ACTIQ8_004623 [Vibrio parahaemolyticus]
MDKLSTLARDILLDKETTLLSTLEVLNSINNSQIDKHKLREIESFILLYSYNRCHELTFWLSEQLPDFKVAVFHGSKSRRPAHSAIVLPSGFLFDAQGVRDVHTVFNEYNQLTQEHRGETIEPARFLTREQLFEVMIEVTRSFNTKTDVEISFAGRKGDIFTKINSLFDLINLHTIKLNKTI